jgi:Mannosyl-glycoprotein endo-beta-N-acetylglucosaminidase
LVATLAIGFLLFSSEAGAQMAELPEIIVRPENVVPACVTPMRLMDFVRNRDGRLDPPRDIDPRFSNIAFVYKSVGSCVETVNEQCVGIRWDYAFFQMLIETNFLLFSGGVKPDDNNFAGIGANVSGKPGMRFDSLKDGVLAHLQHILMYAGISIRHPVNPRTKAVEQDIREMIGELDRPVTFSDLATIWTGTDPVAYASGIQKAAVKFSNTFCKD